MNHWPPVADLLAAHPWVARAAVCADGAAVLPTAAGIEALRRHGRPALLDAWQAWLAERNVPAPAAWRLLDAWDADAASVLRQPPLTDAMVEHEQVGADGSRELSLRLPLDLACFADHFPALPVLPGVVQLRWALGFGAARFGTPGACHRMEMLKFQSLLRPGDRPVLRLRHDAATRRLHFVYRLGATEASSGRFVCEDVA